MQMRYLLTLLCLYRTMLRCQLFNSTYNVSFDYVEGSQNISISVPRADSDRAMPGISEVLGIEPVHPEIQRCLLLSFSTDVIPDHCSLDPEVLRVLSYQAIMDAFTTNLKGRIFLQAGELEQNTNILNTALLNTPELSFLKVNPSKLTLSTQLQTILRSYNSTEVQGLENNYDYTSQQSLQEAIEDLFQKVTISLMSSSALQ